MHVLLRRDPGNGGFVHAHRGRHVVQDHRPHGLGTVLEEALLALDDAPRHLEQRLVAALQALDEPLRFLQVVAQEHVVGGIVGATDHRRIVGIDAQAWRYFRVELHQPAAVALAHDHVRDHVFRGARADHAARTRVELLDAVDRRLELRFADVQAAHQRCVVLGAQQLDVLVDDHARMTHGGFFGVELAQLDQQALAQVAGAHADRVEMLDAMQDRDDFVDLDPALGAEALGKVLEAHAQHAVGIDGVDDGHRDHAIGFRHRRQVELPQQVVGKRGCLGGVLLEVLSLFAAARRTGAAGLVDIVPAGVDGEIGGHRFGGHVIDRVGLRHLALRRSRILLRELLLRAGHPRHHVVGRRALDQFEQRVTVERLLDFLLQVQRRQLEQTYRLLQLGRHGQVLTQFELERLLHERCAEILSMIVANRRRGDGNFSVVGAAKACNSRASSRIYMRNCWPR